MAKPRSSERTLRGWLVGEVPMESLSPGSGHGHTPPSPVVPPRPPGLHAQDLAIPRLERSPGLDPSFCSSSLMSWRSHSMHSQKLQPSHALLYISRSNCLHVVPFCPHSEMPELCYIPTALIKKNNTLFTVKVRHVVKYPSFWNYEHNCAFNCNFEEMAMGVICCIDSTNGKY